ncbi:hypothetical protein CLOP_g19517 [Closterium sp. NIES-67]|nr:hypothetical protein CLOP_g19517 [Closterium sp. NIES-67]
MRLTQPELNELRRQLDYLLEKGFVHPSTSPFAAPILFTPKKDGGLRMCIDYRALNRVSIKSRYPIPRVDELIDQLNGAKFFSKIDLQGGYHQIRVNEADCYKTAFRTRYGSYEYTVMPFGLTNAPSTFQLTMNEVFRPLLDKCVIVYLDDFLIYSTNREQHLKDLGAVFSLLQQHRLVTNGSKCEFLKQELEFLGHYISINGVKIDPKKIATIQDWKPPANLHELQRFLGFVNYVRRFIPNMAWVTSPLTDLRQLNSAERNYPVHDKELLAIVHAFKVWRCYLTGADVTVRTDHKSLQFIRAQSTLNHRQIRWLDYLESKFHYRVTYKWGVSNITDASSPTNSQARGLLPKIWYQSDLGSRLPYPTRATDTGGTRLEFLGSLRHQKTAKLLSRNYYWLDLSTDVQQYVTSCATCQGMKSSRLQPAGLLQPLEPLSRPLQQVTMDFVTGLPAGSSGNDAILVVVDRLTKMAHFATSKTTVTAEQTAKLFLTNIVRLHGIPSTSISDRDPRFTSNFWTKTWQQYGTRLHLSTVYHPQSDGQTKRTNQTMEQLIRTTCTDPAQ